MAIGYKREVAALVPTPPAGRTYTFIDDADGKLKKKDDAGVVTIIEAGGTGVSSVYGRTGAVVAQANDYAANQVSYNPHGTIPHVQVQAAINHLEDNKAPLTHVGSRGVTEHAVATTLEAGFMSPTDKSKLDAVQAGATANQSDAFLLNRANHTGTQLASTISDFNTAADTRVSTGISNHELAADPHPQYATDAALTASETASRNRANHTGTQLSGTISDFNSASDARVTLGVQAHELAADPHPQYLNATEGAALITAHEAALDPHPQYTTASEAAAAAPVQSFNGRVGAILPQNGDYTALQVGAEPTGSVASGILAHVSLPDPHSQYATDTDLANGLATKEDVILAGNVTDYYRGDKTFQPLNKSAVGLSNVDNTSDLAKPISTATQAALDLKANQSTQIDTGLASATGLVGGGDLSTNRSLSVEISSLIDIGSPALTDELLIKDVSANNYKKVTASELRGGLIDPDFEIVLREDWITNTTAGAYSWGVTVAGTNASGQLTTFGVGTASRALGCVQIDTGTTATGRATIHTDATVIMPLINNGWNIDHRFRAVIETSLSSATERFSILAGLGDYVGGGLNAVDGLYFKYRDDLNGGRWLAVASAGNIHTEVDTGVLVNNSFNRFRILFMDGATPEAQFFINDALVATITTNLPQNAGQNYGIAYKIEKAVGTAQRNYTLDYSWLRAYRDTNR